MIQLTSADREVGADSRLPHITHQLLPIAHDNTVYCFVPVNSSSPKETIVVYIISGEILGR